jgi:hypothetical protein
MASFEYVDIPKATDLPNVVRGLLVGLDLQGVSHHGKRWTWAGSKAAAPSKRIDVE